MNTSTLQFHQRAPKGADGDAPITLAALPPLSVYVHLPWCLKKCPYCDFNSHAMDRPDPSLLDRYERALVADLDAAVPQVWGRRVSSVFFGGGTPSLFEPERIERLLSALRSRLLLEPAAEITLEANPGTFERERFRAFRSAGVTRLSLGVQSFDDEALHAIGRVHDAAQAHAAATEAREAFDTFNLDLMYALPAQSLAALRSDLRTALSLAPPHLSIYHLTLEPNTYFAKHPPTLPDDDTASAMLDVIAEATQAAGLQRYEVSAFARAGHRCKHNLNYWRFGDYLGLGAGAHGKLSWPNRIERQVRWREPAAYIEHALKGDAVSNRTSVRSAELPFEFMLNATRLRDGFAMNMYAERTGLPWTTVAAAVDQAVTDGLLAYQDASEGPVPMVVPTARGFDFLTDLQSRFLT